MARNLYIKILGRLMPVFMAMGMSLAADAQEDVLLTQYWAIPTYYNPGATGELDFVRIRGGGRMQWIGIENAPKSFMASADAPFQLGKKRVGVGVNMSQESLGLFSNMQMNIQASYKLKLFKGVLSIGLQGGYFNSKFKGSEVYIPEGDDYHESGDEAIPTRDMTGSSFDFSAGVWYTHKYFNIGISGQHLMEPTVKFDSEGAETAEMSQYETKLKRAIYLISNGNIGIKNTLFELQPSLLLKSDFSRISAEATIRATYKKMFWGGIGYRYKDAVSIMLGAEIKNFFIAYAYDYPTSAISRVSSGSHEVMLGYQVKLDFSAKNKNKHRSIRIM